MVWEFHSIPTTLSARVDLFFTSSWGTGDFAWGDSSPLILYFLLFVYQHLNYEDDFRKEIDCLKNRRGRIEMFF